MSTSAGKGRGQVSGDVGGALVEAVSSCGGSSRPLAGGGRGGTMAMSSTAAARGEMCSVNVGAVGGWWRETVARWARSEVWCRGVRRWCGDFAQRLIVEVETDRRIKN
jgi:hypothetical protein